MNAPRMITAPLLALALVGIGAGAAAAAEPVPQGQSTNTTWFAYAPLCEEDFDCPSQPVAPGQGGLVDNSTSADTSVL